MRAIVNVRVAEKGLLWLDQLAQEHEVTRSEVVRIALAVASRHRDEIDDILAPKVGVDNF